MADTQKIHWKFPEKKFNLLKIEKVFLILLTVLVFVFSFLEVNRRWFLAVVYSLLFLGLYFLMSYLVQRIREVEEHYHLTPTHLHVERKKKGKVKKEKVALKDVEHHKLDKFFLGGYLLAKKKKKHLLFFNTKEELENVEKFLKKNISKK
ncbi:MAG: hypothetical protein KKA62_02100 [Nanoarchaeota archaeon]|nr:hypothetical protein [Nanoarchaeota archaeon]MBU1644101.1 hypothetical protein [Nanoarchaeota archaeon]MBU1976727.1 hypothetical protein [Nanoarchaeota archaeon]